MKVGNSLSRFFAIVGNYAVAFDSFFLCDFCDNFEDVSDDAAVFFVDFACAGDVFLRNYKEMGRSLGVDVVEGENFFVFINFAAGNDSCGNFAEKSVFHKIMLLSGQNKTL